MGQNIPAVTLGEIKAFLERTGARGARTISLLGRLRGFAEAMQTEVGFELLKDDVARHDEIFIKIYDETATADEKAEFRVLKHRLEKSLIRINAYISNINKIRAELPPG